MPRHRKQQMEQMVEHMHPIVTLSGGIELFAAGISVVLLIGFLCSKSRHTPLGKSLIDVLVFHVFMQASDENLYLIMMDSNKFKEINDIYGHVEGDRALLIIAETLKNVADLSHGFVSRYGGDEFVLVYETDEERKVEALCSLIHDMLQKAARAYDLKYSLTMSIGYAKCPDKSIAVQELIRLADKQLYRMKHRTYHCA